MKIGIYTDTADEYNREPHIRASVLKEMQISPGHYLSALKAPPIESKSFDEGIATHSVCLEQSTERFVRRPDGIDGRTKDGKSKLLELEATGKIVLPGEVYDSMGSRLETFCGSSMAMSLYNGSAIEQSHYVRDPVTGLHLKARPDMNKSGVIADFKTTYSMERFERDIWNLKYYIQVGFYSLVLELSTGTEFNSFYFIAQEKTAPYGIQVFSMDRESVNFSKEKARDLLHRVAACMEVNQFPIYSDVIKQVRVPSWVFAKELYSEEAI